MKTHKQKVVGQTWRLKYGLLYGGLKGLECVLVADSEAQVFDSRDNRELKQKFWSAICGVPFTVEET